MLIDRMVKAGLLKRVRDRSDRRVVNVTMTSKAENAIKPATLAGWEFISKIVSPLSYEDRRAFVRLHELVKYEALKYLEPGVDIEEIKKNDVTNQPYVMEKLAKYISASGAQAKRRGGGRGKAR